MKPQPPRLYLVRHGETEWSLSGRHTGRTDLPLTLHGEEEAKQLGHRIRNIRFTRTLTSPLKRARQTCELTGLRFGCETEPDLSEWDYGNYEGMRTDNIHKKRPDWNVFRDGCPNGESPAKISDRADRLLGHLRSLEGNIAVFTHGQIGSVLAMRWIGLPVIDGQHFPLGTASLSILGYEPSHPEIPVLELWNSIGIS